MGLSSIKLNEIKTIKHTSHLALAVSIMLLSACSQWQERDRMTRFEETFRLYSKHLRWGHFHQVSEFMTQRHAAESLNKADNFRGTQISSVRAASWIVDEAKEKVAGNVMIDYYMTNRAVIRQTTQDQTWLWNGKNWKLDNGLPDLH